MQTDTQRGKGHVTIEQRLERCVYKPKKLQRMWTTRGSSERGVEWLLPQSLWKDQSYGRPPWCWTSGLQSCERIGFGCCKSLRLSSFPMAALGSQYDLCIWGSLSFQSCFLACLVSSWRPFQQTWEASSGKWDQDYFRFLNMNVIGVFPRVRATLCTNWVPWLSNFQLTKAVEDFMEPQAGFIKHWDQSSSESSKWK